MFAVQFIKDLLKKEFIRFLFIGGINTLIGYLIYSIAFLVIKNEMIALVLDYVLSIAINFKTYSAFVFGGAGRNAIIMFIFSYLFTFALNSLILKSLIVYASLHPLLAQLAALTICPLCLYFMLKYLVFTVRNQPKQRTDSFKQKNRLNGK